MHFSLLMVGAYDGRNQRDMVVAAAARAPALLVEPMPHLFAALKQTFAGVPHIIGIRCCVALEEGSATFYALPAAARALFPMADQLGSLRPDHAARHEPALAAHVAQLSVKAVTFRDIVERHDITSLDMLVIDAGGSDTTMLPSFPFERIKPKQIVFAFQHGDGTFNVGRKLGRLLIMLDDLGYDVRVADTVNCVATLRT